MSQSESDRKDRPAPDNPPCEICHGEGLILVPEPLGFSKHPCWLCTNKRKPVQP